MGKVRNFSVIDVDTQLNMLKTDTTTFLVTLGYKSTLKTLRSGKAKLVIIAGNTPPLRTFSPKSILRLVDQIMGLEACLGGVYPVDVFEGSIKSVERQR